MTTKNGIDYAAPYHKVKGARVADWQLPHSDGNTEVACPADDLTVEGGIARWGGGLCALRVSQADTYATLKARLVKLRYSLDDQMAVMLNGGDAEMAAMQAWRAWAADVAGRIVEKLMTTPQSGAAQ